MAERWLRQSLVALPPVLEATEIESLLDSSGSLPGQHDATNAAP
jgi:hypothetical protein